MSALSYASCTVESMSSDPWHDLADSLTRVCDAHEAIHRQAPEGIFADGSPAALESANEPLADAWGSTPTADCSVQVLLSIAGMIDHLRGMSVLLKDQTSGYAVFTVARSALDIAAQSWYLLEPGIRAEERALRGINVRLQSLWEQVQIFGDGEDSQAIQGRHHAQSRIDEILNTAKRLSIPRRKGDRGRSPRVGDGLKATSRLVGECVSDVPTLGPLYWRFGSAIAHGQPHGLLTAFTEIPGAEGRPGTSQGLLQIDAQQTAVSGFGTLMGALSALERLYAHLGWPPGEVDQAGRRAYMAWGRVAGLPAAAMHTSP